MKSTELKALLSYLSLIPTSNKATTVASDLLSEIKGNVPAIEKFPSLCMEIMGAGKSEINSQVAEILKDDTATFDLEELRDFYLTPYLVKELRGKVIEDHMIFYNREKDVVTDLDATYVRHQFKKQFGQVKEKWPVFVDSAETVELTYDPNLPRIIEEEDKILLNTYIKPDYLDAEAQEVPEILHKFFDFFFPEDESREYFYHWLYTSIFGRCKQFLILIDKGGTGKSNVLFPLLRGLIGPSNTVTETTSGFTGRFNGHWAYKQLLIAEEIVLRDKNHKEKIKSLDGEVVPIEKKGKEKILVENHLSVIASTNSLDALKLDLYDRKFSIPQTSPNSMENDTKFGFNKDENRSQLIAAVKDPRVLRGFRDYLEKNWKPAEGIHSPFKSHNYERALLSCSPYFIKEILRNIVNGRNEENEIDVLSVASLFRKERKRNFPRERFESWMEQFTWHDKLLGKFDGKDKEIFLIDSRFHDQEESTGEVETLVTPKAEDL